MRHLVINPAVVVHARARRLQSKADRAWIGIWPWVASFALAATVALAVDHTIAGALVANMHAEPRTPRQAHTIILTSTDAQGEAQFLVCVVPPNVFGADELVLSAVDLIRLSTQFQCDNA